MNIDKRKGLSVPLMMKLKNLPAYFADRTVSPAKKLMLLAGVFYVVLPIDLLPDFIPVIGWLDDIGVLGMMIPYLMRELETYTLDRVAIERA